jgi:hypothetical protein
LQEFGADISALADHEESVEINGAGFRPLYVIEGGGVSAPGCGAINSAKVFGRCERNTDIAPVDRLIAEVMSQDKSARRVFWIMDKLLCPPRPKGGRSGRSSSLSMAQTCSRAHPQFTQVGSIQIEIYFSIVSRKVLTPNDFKSLRLLAFQ